MVSTFCPNRRDRKWCLSTVTSSYIFLTRGFCLIKWPGKVLLSTIYLGKQKPQSAIIWSLTLLTYLVISSNINLLFLKSFLWCYSTIDVHWLHFNTLELWPLYVLFELFLLWNVQNIVVLSTLLCIDVYLVHSRGFDIKIAKKTKVRYLPSR